MSSRKHINDLSKEELLKQIEKLADDSYDKEKDPDYVPLAFGDKLSKQFEYRIRYIIDRQESKRKYCYKCGSSCDIEYKYCPECGAPLHRKKHIKQLDYSGDYHICSKCHSIVLSSDHYCSYCGNRFITDDIHIDLFDWYLDELPLEMKFDEMTDDGAFFTIVPDERLAISSGDIMRLFLSKEVLLRLGWGAISQGKLSVTISCKKSAQE